MKTFIVIFLCLLGVLSTLVRAQSDSNVNTWPIVGVFTQPSSSTQGSCGGDCLYLAASYVKFIEAAGARVVPINYYASKTELDKLFTSLNGFLFVGGGSAYPPSAQHIFDKTIEANDNGDYSPLFGVCMGFQWTFLAAANNEVSLDPSDGTQMDAENISLALDFTGAEKQSKFFKDAPQSIIDILGKENVTMNNHHYGVYPSSYDSTPAWKNFFNVLSTNVDREGTAFLSTVEAYKYPVYATQWHPEKNLYEWQKVDGVPAEAINHSPDAMDISRYVSHFWVQEARKSNHRFADAATEESSLIYNYPKVATTGSFVETYFFDKSFKSFNE